MTLALIVLAAALRTLPAEGATPSAPVTVTARFEGEKPAFRAAKDFPFRHDMTAFDGVSFDIEVGDLDQFSHFSFYYKAGNGWYSKEFDVQESGRRESVFVPKTEGCKEGDFAGFEKVEAVRICGWRAGKKNTTMTISNLRPYRLDEEGSADERAARAAAKAAQQREAIAALPPGPADEFRAFWCHSPNGMPGMTWDAAVKLLKDSGFNALFVNLAWGGWARVDKFDEIKAACRKYGVKMHVWKVCWHMWWGGPEGVLAPIERAGRCTVGADGRRERWLCPNDPANRKMEADLFVAFAKRDPDGVHFDYIRYPDANRCFCDRCRALFEKRIGRKVEGWPQAVRTDAALAAEWNAFRCETITSFVREVSRRVRAETPGVELSAAVMSNPSLSLNGVAQDWSTWCEEGLLDFICPMDYVNSLRIFGATVARQKKLVGKVRLYPGLGLSSDGIDRASRTPRIAGQIQKVRELGLDGFVIFNFDKWALETLDCLSRGLTRPAGDGRMSAK